MNPIGLNVTAVLIGNDWYDVEKGTFETDKECYFSFVHPYRLAHSIGPHPTSGQRISGPITSLQALRSDPDE